MYKSNLIEILRTFSAQEIKYFGAYVRSPYFNSNKRVTDLYRYIRKLHPALPKEKLKKEIVYRKLFDKGKYNDSVMRVIMFRLAKLTEDFLTLNHLKAEPAKQNQFLLEEYMKRGANRLFGKKYRESLAKTEGKEEISSAAFQDTLNRLALYYDYLQSIGETTKEQYEAAVKYSETLLCFFLSESLTTMVALRVINPAEAEKAAGNMLPQFFSKLDTSLLTFNKDDGGSKLAHIINLFYFLIGIENGTVEKESYPDAKNIVLKYQDSFGKKDLYGILVMLSNFLIRHIRGSEEFEREFFGLLKHMLKTGAYNLNGSVMVFGMFDNIISSAIANGAISWVEEFIEQYKDMLAPESRENTLNYAYARLEFEKGNFDRALEFAAKVKDEYSRQKIKIKLILIQIFFEKGEYRAAASGLDAFRHFLPKTQDLNPQVKEDYILFTKLVTKLVKLRKEHSAPQLEALERKTMSSQPIARRWLLAKIEETKRLYTLQPE